MMLEDATESPLDTTTTTTTTTTTPATTTYDNHSNTITNSNTNTHANTNELAPAAGVRSRYSGERKPIYCVLYYIILYHIYIYIYIYMLYRYTYRPLSGPRKPCWRKPRWQIYAHGPHG